MLRICNRSATGNKNKQYNICMRIELTIWLVITNKYRHKNTTILAEGSQETHAWTFFVINRRMTNKLYSWQQWQYLSVIATEWKRASSLWQPFLFMSWLIKSNMYVSVVHKIRCSLWTIGIIAHDWLKNIPITTWSRFLQESLKRCSVGVNGIAKCETT